MANPINIHSKAYWNNYALTAQYDAGQYLGARANEHLLQEARDDGRISPAYRPVIINYTAPFIDLSSRVVPQAAPARPQTAEEREQERADLAKVIGSVVAVVGAFIFAKLYKDYATSRETLAYTQAVHGQLVEWNQNPSALRQDIHRLTAAQLEIDELNAAKISKYTLAALGLLVSGALMAIGGFAAVGALITIGQITLVASAVLAAATLGWHWDDDQIIRRNCENIAGRAGNRPMQGVADRILTALPYVDDNLGRVALADAKPPQYLALYPELFHPDAPPPAYVEEPVADPARANQILGHYALAASRPSAPSAPPAPAGAVL